MVEGGTFNITNTDKPVNEDIIVSFSPSANIVRYDYTVYKDGNATDTVNVTNNRSSSIYLDETGKYQITVIGYDAENNAVTNNSGIYEVDKEAPIINLNQSHLTIHPGDKVNLEEGVRATDNFDGNITSKITYNEIDLNNPGEQKLTYTVSDEAGNVATKDVIIDIQPHSTSLLFLQIVIIVLLILVIIPIIKLKRSLSLEKRIEPFIIEPIKGHTSSAFDRLLNIYHRFTAIMVEGLKKSVFAQKYAKKLDKYATVSVIHQNGLEIVAGKIILSLFFVLIAVFATTIQLRLISVYEIALPLLAGFFMLDILYFVKYKVFRSKLENDFLSAIIVMNNAFKSGRSISQAIDIVGDEVAGVIGREFKKMALELSYGLGIDVIFKRFSERVKLEEVSYLTASLTILNKTGGNITEVFDAIEKNLFNKKKLRLELKSLTGSSKIIVTLLLAVPFLFVLFVTMINPTYFLPFFTTKLGIALLMFIIIYYIIFVICVRKIMKVVI